MDHAGEMDRTNDTTVITLVDADFEYFRRLQIAHRPNDDSLPGKRLMFVVATTWERDSHVTLVGSTDFPRLGDPDSHINQPFGAEPPCDVPQPYAPRTPSS
jgi:hypothetical protein